MKRVTIYLITLLLTSHMYAQEVDKVMEGTITFVTSTNVYVRFESTETIKIGEVLQLSNSDCLRVSEKSSTSVVCSLINNCLVKSGDIVTYKFTIKDPVDTPTEIVKEEPIPVETTGALPAYTGKESDYSERIRGRVSVASYNTFSDVREDRNRLMTRFSLNADHIGDSKISVETYLAYRNILSTSENYDGRTSIFNLYNLNVRYDATPTLSVTAGRRINAKASTIGAIDGAQVEKYFGNFYVGAVGGFRPDFFDYGFNSDLLQYGGYVGIETNEADFSSQTTLGAIQQTNSGATDRRYIFFQHYSTIASNLNLFSSVEFDIFGNTGVSTRLTNLYISARYRISRAANFALSYDSRKQIIYYETFQTDIERILDDDLARQGIRARLNVRPAKIIWAGISYSSRFQSNDQNKSDNFYGYATLTRIPKIGGRLNVSYNMNKSNYLTSDIFAVRHSRELVKGKLNGDIYYRMANYAYENREMEYTQNYYGAILSYRIDRSWQFSISGEFSQLEDENSYRFYTRLIKRFNSKKKG